MEFVLAFCITIYSCVHNQLKDSYLKYIDAYKGEYLDTTTHTTHTDTHPRQTHTLQHTDQFALVKRSRGNESNNYDNDIQQ